MTYVMGVVSETVPEAGRREEKLTEPHYVLAIVRLLLLAHRKLVSSEVWFQSRNLHQKARYPDSYCPGQVSSGKEGKEELSS